MPFVNVDLLKQEGVPEERIQEYLDAVEAAWAEVLPDLRGLGSRPLMFLQLQNPAKDRETVTVTVGMGAKYGGTSAKTPAALRPGDVDHPFARPIRARWFESRMSAAVMRCRRTSG